MEVSHIVAVSNNLCIGKGNDLPWNAPKDLKYFKDTTRGYPIIMGRKTYESIGRPLPKRLNIVLTRDETFSAPDGVLVFSDIEEAIDRAKKEEKDKVFIAGGGEIFKKTLSIVDKVYITRIDCQVEGCEAYYPELGEEFELESSKKDHDNYDLDFQVYKRKES